MARKKCSYEAGDWVALPVNDKFAAALLARVNKDGICVGYFFGGLYDAPPPVDLLQHLRPNDAILIHRFVGPYLKKGRWHMIGHDSRWDPSAWPLPAFRYKDDVSGKWYIREYGDDKALWIVSEHVATAQEVAELPQDGCADAKYIEEAVAELLGFLAHEHCNRAASPASRSADPPRHYLYFHDRDLAERATEACGKLGYDPVFAASADEEKPWLVLASHKTKAATEEEMERAAEQLASVAEEWGGEYDGWDKPEGQRRRE